jgi:hypothetical protein
VDDDKALENEDKSSKMNDNDNIEAWNEKDEVGFCWISDDDVEEIKMDFFRNLKNGGRRSLEAVL